MEENKKLSRTVDAVTRIYRTKGIDLSQDEATAVANQLGRKPARAAILCGLIILALVVFLIVRFVL